MGLWQRMIAPFRKASSDAVGSELAQFFDEYGQTSAGVAINSFTAMQQSAVMACVSILSEDVAKLPVTVMRRKPNGGKERADNHPLTKLLRRPNEWQTRFEWVETMQASLVLRSNAYSVKLRNGRGQVIALVPIHPDRVVLYEAPDGSWFYLVTRNGLHEMAVLREMPMMIPAEDVLHIRWLSNWNSLLGVSRVGLMREAIGLAMAQEQLAARVAGTGARPSGVLQTDKKLGDDVIDRLRNQWAKTYGGLRNAGGTVILEEGMKWEQLTLSMVDAEFMASRQFQLEDICRAFRIPPHKLGIQGKGNSNTLMVNDQDYVNNVLTSWCERWKAKLESDFDIDGYDVFVEWDYSHFLKADIKTRYDAMRSGVIGMFLKPNEIRAAEGLEPAEGGDVLYQPVNMAPLGTVPTKDNGAGGAGSDLTGAPGSGGDGDPGRDEGGDAPSPA
jgi:HK97 family phage portal protein